MNNIIQFPAKRRRAITVNETPTVRTVTAPVVVAASEKKTFDWEGRTITLGTSARHPDQPTLHITYKGPRAAHAKTLVNYRYHSVARRDEALEIFKQSVINNEQRKAERKAEASAQRAAQKQNGHSIKVGDCLYASWGYDQTNVDFYQVTRVSKSSVWFRAISGKTVSSASGCDQVSGAKDAFLPDDHYKANGEVRRTVRAHSFRGETSYTVSYSRQSLSVTSFDSSHYATGAGYGH